MAGINFDLVFQYVMPVVTTVFSVACAIIAGQNRDAIKSLDVRLGRVEDKMMKGGKC